MMTGLLARYIGWRFLSAFLAIFIGLFTLTVMVDFIEMMRRTAEIKDASALLIGKISLYRVPFLTERLLPFGIMIAVMYAYLDLTRRLELVVARSAGVSVWQFLWPAIAMVLVLGIGATTLYNPLVVNLRESSLRLENELWKDNHNPNDSGNGFWIRQRTSEGHSLINASSSSNQGVELTGVTVFRLDQADRFQERIEAKAAVLEAGFWRLQDVRIYGLDGVTDEKPTYELKTNLTPREARESFATPDAVPFWQLAANIDLAENAGLAAAGYRLQYYRLLLQPLYLAAMVLLAAAVSLRSFRFGGVQKMVLGGIAGGFALYVVTKVTDDVTNAGLMSPVIAALLPIMMGGLTGLMALLYQEDG